MRVACVKDKYKSPWYFMRVCDKLLGILWECGQHGLVKCGSGILAFK